MDPPEANDLALTINLYLPIILLIIVGGVLVNVVLLEVFHINLHHGYCSVLHIIIVPLRCLIQIFSKRIRERLRGAAILAHRLLHSVAGTGLRRAGSEWPRWETPSRHQIGGQGMPITRHLAASSPTSAEKLVDVGSAVGIGERPASFAVRADRLGILLEDAATSGPTADASRLGQNAMHLHAWRVCTPHTRMVVPEIWEVITSWFSDESCEPTSKTYLYNLTDHAGPWCHICCRFEASSSFCQTRGCLGCLEQLLDLVLGSAPLPPPLLQPVYLVQPRELLLYACSTGTQESRLDYGQR